MPISPLTLLPMLGIPHCVPERKVSNKVKRFSIGGAVVLLAAAAAVPRGVVALWLAGSALASSGKGRRILGVP